ncbi:MAG: ATP-binding protein, partial [Methanobrevibacter sp.]|nr:ATP-binding protein [Methanobrevibacter sp.]
ALHDGIKALEPGILAAANRNILYIDEINLLDDNLVDVLLDAAAYGINIIEREGISISHPSQFILVGTMNPEEGELRGQLSDRIGLEIDVEGIGNIDERILIMKRREEFEQDPEAFVNKFKEAQKELQDTIVESIKRLDDVEISDVILEIIARITLEYGSEGHRTDISILKSSKTIAAFKNHKEVDEGDLKEAIELVVGEDRYLEDKIRNIKRDIERRNQEEKENNPTNDIEDLLQNSLEEKLKKNQNTGENQKEDEEIERKELEYLEFGDGKSKDMDFTDDSDFKAKDDFASGLNEGEQVENFNEIILDGGRIDIKKY